MTDIEIRTTITANSLLPLFGPPGAIDYRTHPNQRKPDTPIIIFKAMKQKESPPLTDIKILKGTIYSYKNRRIITIWIRSVCTAFSLKSTTLSLAVVLTDSHIVRNINTLDINNCQLVAIVCTWIAAKFEELADIVPSVKSLVEVCDGAYNKDDIINTEEEVLEGFRWKIPHSTCVNFMYLYLHMHGNPEVARPLFGLTRGEVSDVGAEEATNNNINNNNIINNNNNNIKIPPGHILAHIYIQTTTSRKIIPVTLQSNQTFQSAIPILCKAANILLCNNNNNTVEIYELAGNDFFLAKRVPKDSTPNSIGMKEGNTIQYIYKLFISVGGTNFDPMKNYNNTNNNNNNTTSNNTATSAVFAEVDNIIIIRSLNSQVLELAEELAAEAVTHVEFLRLPSHIISLAVIGLARAITAKVPKEARDVILFIISSLGVSGSQAFAAAELLLDKYVESLPGRRESLDNNNNINNSNNNNNIVVEPPADVHGVLRYIFSR